MTTDMTTVERTETGICATAAHRGDTNKREAMSVIIMTTGDGTKTGRCVTVGGLGVHPKTADTMMATAMTSVTMDGNTWKPYFCGGCCLGICKW